MGVEKSTSVGMGLSAILSEALGVLFMDLALYNCSISFVKIFSLTPDVGDVISKPVLLNQMMKILFGKKNTTLGYIYT